MGYKEKYQLLKENDPIAVFATKALGIATVVAAIAALSGESAKNTAKNPKNPLVYAASPRSMEFNEAHCETYGPLGEKDDLVVTYNAGTAQYIREDIANSSFCLDPNILVQMPMSQAEQQVAVQELGNLLNR